MNLRGYRIRITERSIAIRYRASLWAVVVAAILCLIWLLIVLANFLESDDVAGVVPTSIVLLAGIIGWFRYFAREVVHCDIHELHLARRKWFGRWERVRFPVDGVHGLKRAIRGGGKSAYSVITFNYAGHDWDILRDMDYEQSSQVLNICRSFGFDVPQDVAEAMMLDIAKSGWWVNPWRKDDISKQ